MSDSKLAVQGRNPDGSIQLKVTLPVTAPPVTYTLSRGPDVRPPPIRRDDCRRSPEA